MYGAQLLSFRVSGSPIPHARRPLVTALEQSVVDLAAGYGIDAAARPDAPGVYVSATKFASVGLRIRRGASYHGMALNVSVDLAPFLRINPCGYEGLAVTQLRDCVDRPIPLEEAQAALLTRLAELLGYNGIRHHEH